MSRVSVPKALFVLLAPALSASLAFGQPLTAPYGAPISLDDAKTAAGAAHAKAREMNVSVVIAVVDPAGLLVYLEKMDGVQHGSLDVAIDKARSAALFRRPTKWFLDGLTSGGAGVRFLTLRGAVPLNGGVPILMDGRVVGAIGLSGASSEQDGEAATAGADALLTP